MARLPRRRFLAALYFVLIYSLLAPSLAPAQLALAAGPACSVGASGAGYTTVQAAVNDSSCATISIAAGTYSENITINRSVSLQGAGAASTIIDGHAANSVFIIGSGATVAIAGVTTTHGLAADGGGIRNSGTLTLSNSTVISNKSSLGDFGESGPSSGIANSGSMTLNNSTVTQNVGGGILNSGSMMLNNSVVTQSAGGGITSNGPLTLNNTSVSDNQGSGIRSTSDATITNTTISGNLLLGASFIRTETTPATVALTNVTISGNRGGAIENTATLTIANSSLTNNAASNGDILNNGSFTLKNTIIANSTLVPNCAVSAALISNGHNIDSGNTCGLTGPGDKINADPKLGPLRDNGGPTRTQALRPGSPAIDAGDNNGCPTTDQRGGARVATCDIGAYEYRAGLAPITISPASIEAGSPAITLIVNGAGFTNGAAVQLNGVDRPTTFVSASKLLAAISTDDIADASAIEVTVANPGLAGSTPAATLTVTPNVTDRSGIAYVGSIGGGVPTVAISGTMAYIGEGSQLTILNISNPAAPVRLGSFTTRTNVLDVEVVGKRAYVTADSDGLLILDVSDSAHPTLLGSIDTPGRAYDVQVVGTRAYVADESGGLRIIDVSNPAAPTELGFYDTGVAYDLSIVGNIAYLATGNGFGIDMIDISDPTHPTKLSTLFSLEPTLGVQVVGTIAYIAAGDAGLQLFNAAGSLNQGSMISSVGTLGKVKDLAVAGDRAYVVNYDGTLHIVDVSDPIHPLLLASYDTPGDSWDVRVVGNRAYVADGIGGLLILDVSDSLHPVKLGSFATWSGYKIKVVANRAYIAGGSGGLQVLDVANPAQPFHLGSFTTTSPISNLAINGNRAALIKQAHWNGSAWLGGGLEIVDVTDPSHITALGNYPIEDPHDVQLVGTRAYVTSNNRLHILDISNPGAITLLGLGAAGGFSVQVVGNRAYTANDSDISGELIIFDVSNPAAPTIIGSAGYQVNHAANSVIQVVGNTAYVTGGYTLSTINVSDPAHPYVTSMNYARSSAITDIKIVGSIAYLAESSPNDGYFDLMDISAPLPSVLNEISRHDLSRPLNGVDVVGNLAYTVSEQGGLHILRIHQELYPATLTLTPAGGSLSNRDGSVTLAFPPNAVTTPITITYTGLITSTQLPGGVQTAGYSFLLEARDSAGRPVTHFDQPYTLIISYTDAQLAAIGINEADLNLGFWNGSAWVGVLPCAGCGVDTVNNRLTAVLDHFTEFALVGGKLPAAANEPSSIMYLPMVRR